MTWINIVFSTLSYYSCKVNDFNTNMLLLLKGEIISKMFQSGLGFSHRTLMNTIMNEPIILIFTYQDNSEGT